MSKLSNVKERPILMTPQNAQKCHEGTKTQTRRIVKDINPTFLQSRPNGHQIHNAMRCPYGEVGDRLWVREAWALWREGWDRTGHVIYRGGMVDKARNDFLQDDLLGLGKWKPSLHMPRKYCRTVLEITELRVERVQDISQEDARAEGIEDRERAVEIGEDTNRKPCLGCGQRKAQHVGSVKVCFGSHGEVFDRRSLKGGYSWLWESINGKGSWERNDWVWVVSFKKMKAIE